MEYPLIAIIIVLAVFFILREFFTWYWKINKIVENLTETNMLLKELVNYNLYGIKVNDKNPELIIRNTQTGREKGMSRKEWEEYLADNPNQTIFEIVKDNSKSKKQGSS